MTAIIVIAATAAGYLLGRVRPWRRLGDWAEDEISFARWENSGRARRIAVALTYSLNRPLASWRIMRDGPPQPMPAPTFDSNWAAKQSASAESSTQR